MPETRCVQFTEEFLQLALSDGLDDANSARLADHLECCSICRGRLDSMIRNEASIDRLPQYDQQAYDRVKANALRRMQEACDTFSSHPPEKIGRYVVIRLLNTGGMSRVYECLDERLNRRVAIKVLPDYMHDPSRLERLKREARLQAGLKHPNVVGVHEVEIEATPPYIVMELMEGGSLKDLSRAEPIAPRSAAFIVAKVARAVQESHSVGFLHRDIKPSNILIEKPFDIEREPIESLRMKVSDFGLAQSLESGSDLTKSNIIVGTPTYMSPEQTLAGYVPMGCASDIYSLGVLLYELIVGRPPLATDNVGLTLAMIREVEPIAPRTIQPNVSKDLNTICMKCLEKSPSRRYASARALAEDLENYLAGKPIQARPVSDFAKAWRWCGRNRLVAISISLAFISLLTLAGVSVWFALVQKNLVAIAEQNRQRARLEAKIAIQNLKLMNERKISVGKDLFAELQNSGDKFNELIQTPREDLTPERIQTLSNEYSNKWLDSAQKLYNELENDFSEPEFNIQIAAFIAQVYNNTGRAAEAAKWQRRVTRLALNYPSTDKLSVQTLELIYKATLACCGINATKSRGDILNHETGSQIYDLFQLERLNEPAGPETKRLRLELGELLKK